MEYLDLWVTCDGVKPIHKNTSNKNMKPPTSRKEVRQIIGVVSYYCNMWERRLHTLLPLTNITPSKVKLKWAKIKRDAFGQI